MDIALLQPPSVVFTRFEQESVEWQLLESSIRKHGLLQPLTVSGTTIVDGYRRWLVCRAIGWTEIPVYEVTGDPDTLRVIAQSRRQEHTKHEKKMILSKLLAHDPELTAGAVAHKYQWSIAEVELVAGLDYVIEPVRTAYLSGAVSLAEIWMMSRLDPPVQLDTLLHYPRAIYERSSELLREVRSTRRREASTRPRLRSYNQVEKEIDHPTVVGPLIIESGAQTALDGWKLALRWVLAII